MVIGKAHKTFRFYRQQSPDDRTARHPIVCRMNIPVLGMGDGCVFAGDCRSDFRPQGGKNSMPITILFPARVIFDEGQRFGTRDRRNNRASFLGRFSAFAQRRTTFVQAIPPVIVRRKCDQRHIIAGVPGMIAGYGIDGFTVSVPARIVADSIGKTGTDSIRQCVGNTRGRRDAFSLALRVKRHHRGFMITVERWRVSLRNLGIGLSMRHAKGVQRGSGGIDEGRALFFSANASSACRKGSGSARPLRAARRSIPSAHFTVK